MNDRFLPVLVLALSVVGCGNSQAGRAMNARVDTLASGRVVVANTGAPAWSPETAWRLEEDLRLGSAVGQGRESQQFGAIASVATDSRGRIYVLDLVAQEVRVFDRSGAFSHTIGRKGRGPGEFVGAWELTVGAADTLWVLDDVGARYSAFAPDGTFLKGHRRRIIGYGSSLRRTVLHDGRYVDWVPASPEGRFGPRVLYYPVRYALGFERVDTLPPIENTREMLPSRRMPQMYFVGYPVAAVDRTGGIWFANSREYRIYRRSLEGDTTLAFSLPAEAPPLEDADRERVRQGLARRPSLLAEQLEVLPETKPIVHRIVPDDAGHILVFADVAREPAGTAVDVFRESGEYLGRMTVPMPVPFAGRRFPVVHATPEHLFVVVKDELDVPYVSRLKIVKGR